MNYKIITSVGVSVALLVGATFLFLEGNISERGMGHAARQENTMEESASLEFATSSDMANRESGQLSSSDDTAIAFAEQQSEEKKFALLANGCFWCVEHDLEEVDGVYEVVSGYAGGRGENPTYENYAERGYKEVVFVTYNPARVSYANLVEHIIKHGNPTDAKGSFNDRGFEYAPAIYYQNEFEKNEATRVIAAVDARKVFAEPLALALLPITQFYPAEEYHQNYAQKNPLKYGYYRAGSGRTAFIEKIWGDRLSLFEFSNVSPGETEMTKKEVSPVTIFNAMSWNSFVKPSKEKLKTTLTPLQFKVTQEGGTESPFDNEYDKKYDEGIYVDIVSGEPLFFSKDKFDSGTGWPSFVKPISPDVVVLKEETGFFSKQTEVRSRYADSHLGHVFDDGPVDRGGKRYCMNSAAMRFIPKAGMEKEGYGYLVSQI